jgi:hypothetical protein
VRPSALHAVRDHAGPRAGHGRGTLRFLQALRRGGRGPGGAPPRAAGTVHPHQGARRPAGRAFRLSLRRPPDGLAVGCLRRRAQGRTSRGARSRPAGSPSTWASHG